MCVSCSQFRMHVALLTPTHHTSHTTNANDTCITPTPHTTHPTIQFTTTPLHTAPHNEIHDRLETTSRYRHYAPLFDGVSHAFSHIGILAVIDFFERMSQTENVRRKQMKVLNQNTLAYVLRSMGAQPTGVYACEYKCSVHSYFASQLLLHHVTHRTTCNTTTHHNAHTDSAPHTHTHTHSVHH